MAGWIEVKRQNGKPDFRNQTEVKTAWKSGEDFIVTESVDDYSMLGRRVDHVEAARAGLRVIVRYGSGPRGGPGLKVMDVTAKR